MQRSRDHQRARAAVLTLSIAAMLAPTGSCLATATVVCERTGLRCPAGQVCDVDQDACIAPGGCGDGLLGPDEICDDGNARGGDGCSADCRSREECGNGMLDLDVGEECDDGNRMDGDGCSAACTREQCGNRVLDPDEVCDDGNTVPGDGCSASCRSNEACGNGVIDDYLGEQCEFADAPFPHAFEDSELCDNDCTFPVCGDGHLNTVYLVTVMGRDPYHEECDTAGDSPACNDDCTFVRCGDRHVNQAAGEDCDPGQAVDSKDCDSDCTLPLCGDQHTNPENMIRDSKSGHREECDSGGNSSSCNGNDNASGDGDCQRPRCGDGYLNPESIVAGRPEACDPGGMGIPPVNGACPNGCASDCSCKP